ncbi:MAG: hypothetical protein ACI9A1_000688 [Lentimonas sp.]
MTTWNRGAGVQDRPTYASLHEIAATDDWVYIRTTNLASYVMGPWYRNTNRTRLFNNLPSNQADIYRFPRTPVDPITGGGTIGYMVNGGTHVPMIVAGPAVTVAPVSTTDTLVHCVDLFSTILKLAGVNESTVPGLDAMDVRSTSIVPILNGADTTARTIITDDYPADKLIIFGDPDNTKTYEIDPSLLSGDALAAYNAWIAKDTELGGGYSDLAVVP